MFPVAQPGQAPHLAMVSAAKVLLLLFVLVVIFGLSVLAAVVGAELVRMGMRRPWVLRRA